MKFCVSAFACCVNQKKKKKREKREKTQNRSRSFCDFGCARRGVTRRAHKHRNHHPHHRRARDDAMRVRYNNSHARESGEKEREKAIQNLEMIIGYGRTILPSLSLVFSRIFPSRTKSKKQIFLIRDSLSHNKKPGEKVSRTCCCCSSSSGRRGLSHPRRTRSFSRAWQRQTYFNSSES